jgi:hypothetical protein
MLKPKKKSPYTAGNLYLLARNGIWQICGSTEGKRFRVSTGTNDLRLAKKALDNFAHEVHSGWRDVEPGTDWHEAAKTIWNRHRLGAAKRGIPFTITVGEVYAALKETGFMCAVSGIPFDANIKPNAQLPNPWGPSIDRIEVRQGYSPGNIRIVCLIANLAMNRYGYDALLRLSRGVNRSSMPVREPDTKPYTLVSKTGTTD